MVTKQNNTLTNLMTLALSCVESGHPEDGYEIFLQATAEARGIAADKNEAVAAELSTAIAEIATSFSTMFEDPYADHVLASNSEPVECVDDYIEQAFSLLDVDAADELSSNQLLENVGIAEDDEPAEIPAETASVDPADARRAAARANLTKLLGQSA